jgi:membrane-associated phospholipid phosphatase
MKLSKKDKNKILNTLYRLPSIVFSSPVVTTVFTIIIIRLVSYPGLIVSSIFFYLIMPIATYAFLYKRGLITDKNFDFNIRKREERPLYQIILVLGFLTNYILIALYDIPIITEVSLFILISFAIFTIVTIFWKISGHMTQTVLCILTLAYVLPNYAIYILLIGYLVCVPLVAFSRIKLKHHTIWQVIAGTLVTSIIGFIVLYIIF